MHCNRDYNQGITLFFHCSFHLLFKAGPEDTAAPIAECPAVDSIVETVPQGTTSTQVTLPECNAVCTSVNPPNGCRSQNQAGRGYVYFVNNVNDADTNVVYGSTGTFNLGTTIVRCSIRDPAGNIGICRYSVTVNGKFWNHGVDYSTDGKCSSP